MNQTIEQVLQEMKESIGTKDPLIFFDKMVEVHSHLFEKISKIEKDLQKIKLNSILAIQWDKRIAMSIINEEVHFLRKTGKQEDGSNIYENEIKRLQNAYMEDGDFLASYASFCNFWSDLLGHHPFLERDF